MRSGGYVGGLVGHNSWVYRVALTADATKIASGSADGTVKLWTSNGWRLLATLIQLTPRTDQWLITTPAGYLATSSPGAVQWRATGLKTPPTNSPRWCRTRNWLGGDRGRQRGPAQGAVVEKRGESRNGYG